MTSELYLYPVNFGIGENTILIIKEIPLKTDLDESGCML